MLVKSTFIMRVPVWCLSWIVMVNSYPGNGISPDYFSSSKTIRIVDQLEGLSPFLNSDSLSCSIPFIRAGNLILIPAKVDTTQGLFVLDTGCPTLVLNITYFRDYPTTP